MQLEKIERNVFFSVSRNFTFLVGALAAVMVIFFNTIAVADGLKYTDQEAKTDIEKLLNIPSDKIKLGPFSVINNNLNGEPDLNAGRMSQAVYRVYQAMAKAGIITISKDQGYQKFKTGSNFNWMDYGSSINGVSEKIVVTKTSIGDKLASMSSF